MKTNVVGMVMTTGILLGGISVSSLAQEGRGVKPRDPRVENAPGRVERRRDSVTRAKEVAGNRDLTSAGKQNEPAQAKALEAKVAQRQAERQQQQQQQQQAAQRAAQEAGRTLRDNGVRGGENSGHGSKTPSPTPPKPAPAGGNGRGRSPGQ